LTEAEGAAPQSVRDDAAEEDGKHDEVGAQAATGDAHGTRSWTLVTRTSGSCGRARAPVRPSGVKVPTPTLVGRPGARRATGALCPQLPRSARRAQDSRRQAFVPRPLRRSRVQGRKTVVKRAAMAMQIGH